MMVPNERSSWASVEASGPGILQIASRHPWLVMMGILAGLLGGMGYLAVATPQYTSSARLYVQQVRPRVIGEVDARLTFDSNASFLNMQRTVLTSAPVLAIAMEKPGVREIKALAGMDDVVAGLKKQLRVEVGKKDDTISVEFDAADRREGEILVGAVVEAYVTQCLAQGRHTAEELLKILGEEKAACESLIAQQNAVMLALKQAAGTSAFEGKESPGMQTLQSLKDSLKTARAETLSAESFSKEAMAAYGRDAEQQKRIADLEESSGFTIVSDTEDAQLRWAIADQELKLNELVKHYKYMPQNPQVRAVQGRLDELRAAYVVATKRRWAAAKEREQKLQAAVEAQEAIVRDYASKAAEYAKQETELRRLERHADVLDGRINEIRAGQGAGALNITVVEPAHAGLKPTKPKATRTLGMTILAGLMLGTAMAYLQERRMPRLYTIQETKASIALPVLGLLPRMSFRPISGSRLLPAQRQPLSHIAEACRTIHTALRFTPSGEKCRKLVVTSPMSGEGKTTVAGNLAAVLAQSGKRVLLIDAGFRQAMLHRVFGVGNGIGLTNVLQGEESAANAVQHTKVAGLDVLTSGPMPREPWPALDGQRFEAMLGELSEAYDHILVDTPAVTASSNVRVIAALCDGVVLVVRIGKTDPRLAELACEGLLNLGARILGVVINAVPGTAGRDVSYFEPSCGVTPGEVALPLETKTRGEITKGEESLRPAHWAGATRHR